MIRGLEKKEISIKVLRGKIYIYFKQLIETRSEPELHLF